MASTHTSSSVEIPHKSPISATAPYEESKSKKRRRMRGETKMDENGPKTTTITRRKPRITPPTKPHFSAAFAFSLSELIVSDRAENLLKSTTASPQLMKISEQAKLVQNHVALAKQQGKAAALAEAEKHSRPFPLKLLPPELRQQIFGYTFYMNSGKTPKLLQALKTEKDQILYKEAKEIWLKTEKFMFTGSERLVDDTGKELDQPQLQKLQRLSVAISRVSLSNACSNGMFKHGPVTRETDPFVALILQASNIEDLTLRVTQHLDLSHTNTIKHTICHLTKLRRITLCGSFAVKEKTTRKLKGYQPRQPVSLEERKFNEYFVRLGQMLDKVLGVKGKVETWGERIGRVWEAEGKDPFKPVVAKTHVKFE